MSNIFKQISYSPDMIQAILANRKTQTRRLRGLKWANLYGEFSKAEIVHDAEILDLEGEVVKLPGICASFDDGEWVVQSPYQVGDILWVRESFLYRANKSAVIYKADLEKIEAVGVGAMYGGWKPSIHMPKTACRIWQIVKNVRIERVDDISVKDSIAEGIELVKNTPYGFKIYSGLFKGSNGGTLASFSSLWQSIHGQPSPVYKKKNGKLILSHYEVYPFNESLSDGYLDEVDYKKYKGKTLVICPNPWVWVVEFENIFEAPEGFL